MPLSLAYLSMSFWSSISLSLATSILEAGWWLTYWIKCLPNSNFERLQTAFSFKVTYLVQPTHEEGEWRWECPPAWVCSPLVREYPYVWMLLNKRASFSLCPWVLTVTNTSVEINGHSSLMYWQKRSDYLLPNDFLKGSVGSVPAAICKSKAVDWSSVCWFSSQTYLNRSFVEHKTLSRSAFLHLWVIILCLISC